MAIKLHDSANYLKIDLIKSDKLPGIVFLNIQGKSDEPVIKKKKFEPIEIGDGSRIISDRALRNKNR